LFGTVGRYSTDSRSDTDSIVLMFPGSHLTPQEGKKVTRRYPKRAMLSVQITEGGIIIALFGKAPSDNYNPALLWRSLSQAPPLPAPMGQGHSAGNYSQLAKLQKAIVKQRAEIPPPRPSRGARFWCGGLARWVGGRLGGGAFRSNMLASFFTVSFILFFSIYGVR
jgi:hypothetical protein